MRAHTCPHDDVKGIAGGGKGERRKAVGQSERAARAMGRVSLSWATASETLSLSGWCGTQCVSWGAAAHRHVLSAFPHPLSGPQRSDGRSAAPPEHTGAITKRLGRTCQGGARAVVICIGS